VSNMYHEMTVFDALISLRSSVGRSDVTKKRLIAALNREARANNGLLDLSISTLVQQTPHGNKSMHSLLPEDIENLAEALKKNDQVRYLDLSEQPIRDTGIREFAQMLNSNFTLRGLYLQDNDITNDGAKILQEALSKNKTLCYLDKKLKAGYKWAEKNKITDNAIIESINGYLIQNQAERLRNPVQTYYRSFLNDLLDNARKGALIGLIIGEIGAYLGIIKSRKIVHCIILASFFKGSKTFFNIIFPSLYDARLESFQKKDLQSDLQKREIIPEPVTDNSLNVSLSSITPIASSDQLINVPSAPLPTSLAIECDTQHKQQGIRLLA